MAVIVDRYRKPITQIRRGHYVKQRICRLSDYGHVVTQCPIISLSLCVESKHIDWDTFYVASFCG